MYGRALTVITVITVILQALNMWYIGHGQHVYWLMIIIYTGYTAVELMLALRSKAQWSIILFVVLDLWALGMAVYGLVNSGSAGS